MNEVTEHIYPTIGRNVEGCECPVLTGMAREEITRCRDCTHYNEATETCWGYPEAIWMEPDGFCSNAIRKENGNEQQR